MPPARGKPPSRAASAGSRARVPLARGLVLQQLLARQSGQELCTRGGLQSSLLLSRGIRVGRRVLAPHFLLALLKKPCGYEQQRRQSAVDSRSAPSGESCLACAREFAPARFKGFLMRAASAEAPCRKKKNGTVAGVSCPHGAAARAAAGDVPRISKRSARSLATPQVQTIAATLWSGCSPAGSLRTSLLARTQTHACDGGGFCRPRWRVARLLFAPAQAALHSSSFFAKGCASAPARRSHVSIVTTLVKI